MTGFELRHPVLARRLWLNSFPTSVEKLPRAISGIAVVWIRLSTLVLALLFTVAGLVFIGCAVVDGLVD